MDSENNHKPRRPRPTIAHLKGCTRLNVRSAKSPDATVSGVITEKDYIKVDVNAYDPQWYTVLEPVYGFAKKEFLEVN